MESSLPSGPSPELILVSLLDNEINFGQSLSLPPVECLEVPLAPYDPIDVQRATMELPFESTRPSNLHSSSSSSNWIFVPLREGEVF